MPAIRKRKFPLIEEKLLKTGGGSAPPQLTELQKKILGIIGTASVEEFREVPAGYHFE